jgi:hypothetical protein
MVAPPQGDVLVEARPPLRAASPMASGPTLQEPEQGMECPVPLCVVRRTVAMNNVEQRLKFAMVGYIGGNRPAVSCTKVHEALATVNIPEGEVSVHEYAPEDFLVVFAKAEHRNKVASFPSITHGGFCLFFRNWNRQAQAKHVAWALGLSW